MSTFHDVTLAMLVQVNHKQQANAPRERRSVTSRYHGDKIMIWILTIFLDKDGHLHCRTMEEKYGLLFCSWVQSCAGKEIMLTFSFFLCHGPRFVQILLPWQRDVTTSPLQFSSDLFHWEWRGILQTANFRPLFPSNKHLSDKVKHLEIIAICHWWANQVSLLLLSKPVISNQ